MSQPSSGGEVLGLPVRSAAAASSSQPERSGYGGADNLTLTLDAETETEARRQVQQNMNTNTNTNGGRRTLRGSRRRWFAYSVLFCVLTASLLLLTGYLVNLYGPQDAFLGEIFNEKQKASKQAKLKQVGTLTDNQMSSMGFEETRAREELRNRVLSVVFRNNVRHKDNSTGHFVDVLAKGDGVYDASIDENMFEGSTTPKRFENCTSAAAALLPYSTNRRIVQLEVPGRYSSTNGRHRGDISFGLGFGPGPAVMSEPFDFAQAPSAAMPLAAAAAPLGGASAPASAPAPASPSPAPAPAPAPASMPETSSPLDYSKTNVQVEGVDESDIIKTDGNFIYTVGGSELVIIKAFPASERKVVTRLELNQNGKSNRSFLALETLLSGNVLVIFAASQTIEGSGSNSSDASLQPPKVIFQKYSVADKESPFLIWEGSIEGNFITARLTSNIAFLAVQNKVSVSTPYHLSIAPKKTDGVLTDEQPLCECKDIIYIPTMKPKTLVSLLSIRMDENVSSGENQIISSVSFAGSWGWRKPTVMMSLSTIYLAFYNSAYRSTGDYENTVIVSYTQSEGVFEYKGSVEVPGELLNQFSLDEFDGHLRVATTVDFYNPSTRRWTTENMLFVVDCETQQVVGTLLGMAPGETIYSVRFVGVKAYIVTFVQIDPLFVIDLSNPTLPKILGELKIPGYSDYLHPLNETHLLGLGRAGDQTGRIKGIKIALFDCTDPTNPVERYALDIGDRASESIALDDHKAFLQMDLPKLYNNTLIAFPVTLTTYGLSCSSPSSSDFQGIKVFRLDETQFTELASISHETLSESAATEGEGIGEGEEGLGGYNLASHLGKAQMCRSCPAAQVRRSLYIESELFSLSDGYIAAHDMRNWSLTWKSNLHTKQILAPPSDCSIEILQNDLVANFTERFNYSTVWDVVAATLTSREVGSLGECLNSLGCKAKAEVANNYSSQFNDRDWSNTSPYKVWNSYMYCKTSLGRQAFQNLGYYAGNCCSLSTDEEVATCIDKMAKTSAPGQETSSCDMEEDYQISYSRCKIWY